MKNRPVPLKLKLKSVIKQIGTAAADILWPRRCICCDCRVPIGRSVSLCSDCMSLPLKERVVFVEPDRYFEQAVCALCYRDNVRSAMINYKFRAQKYLSDTFSYALYTAVKNMDFLKEYTFICPVPLHPLREREYNQSLLIAAHLAKTLNLKLYPDLLFKAKNLTPLSKMGYSMRRAKIVGALDFNVKYDITGKNIIILDDIYTTGSTADECSKILRMHGAAKVTVLAACYADVKGDTNDVDADNLSDQELWSGLDT